MRAGLGSPDLAHVCASREPDLWLAIKSTRTGLLCKMVALVVSADFRCYICAIKMLQTCMLFHVNAQAICYMDFGQLL
jgi:hypothetical protein